MNHPKIIKECANCNYNLIEGDEVYFESHDWYYCSKECLKEYVIKHIDVYVDDLIEQGIVVLITLESSE